MVKVEQITYKGELVKDFSRDKLLEVVEHMFNDMQRNQISRQKERDFLHGMAKAGSKIHG